MPPRDEVHVRLVRVAEPPQPLPALEALLDAEEREQAHRFRSEAARTRFVVSHGVLRLELGRLTGSAPEALRFARRCGHCGGTDHGKPHLADRSLDFSLSHSGGFALLAVARGRTVGADIEQVGRRTDVLAVARRALAPDERRALAALPTDEARREAFFRCWTRKEAYLKARGEGLAGGLDTFSVPIGDDDPCRPQVPGDPEESARWLIRTIPAPRGYRAAVAAEGTWGL
jgi:4'-phosphopantetheinyl transferase